MYMYINIFTDFHPCSSRRVNFLITKEFSDNNNVANGLWVLLSHSLQPPTKRKHETGFTEGNLLYLQLRSLLSETFNTTEQQNKAVYIQSLVVSGPISGVNSSHTDGCNRRFPKCPLHHPLLRLSLFSWIGTLSETRKAKQFFF